MTLTKRWTLERVLIAMSKLQSGSKIKPCRKKFDDNLTFWCGELMYWYNDSKRSTHTIHLNITEEQYNNIHTSTRSN